MSISYLNIQIPKFITVSCTLAILLLLVVIFTPVPRATDNNTFDVHDSIVNVIEGTSNDILFNLKNTKAKPYINRGLERGLSIKELQSKLNGQKVHLKIVDHWTPLDFNKNRPTLAYIEIADTGEIIFDVILPV